MLSADICEKFIGTRLKYHGLDPCHYFSSHGLSWDAMLKMTGVKPEKLSDIDKYLFIEKGLRGGISYIAKRYTKANNNYMNDYEPKKPSTFISYLDMNNLYGWAMSEYLPYGGFKWLKNVDELDVMSTSEKSPIGYFLEVDLEYPDELYELHNDCPLAQLGNKTNYVVHYRNIQLYLSLAMKLANIHSVLKFKQSDWMKNDINFNTEKRLNAANNFEKYSFKLMFNSVYGKQ